MVAEEGGVLEALAPGGTWIDMSTNDAHELQRLSSLAAAKGIETLEAPVTGGVHRAAAGMITVLVGGKPEVFEKHREAFDAMGGRVFYIGELGQASVIKVITNMLAFIHLVADGEALMLAKKGGDRPQAGLGCDQGQLRQQLRPRDRGPADPQRQLQHQLHDGPGPQGPLLRPP